MMTLTEFLRRQDWIVYRVDGKNRTYFVDTAFGPTWKTLPENVEVDPIVQLTNMTEVKVYAREHASGKQV